MPHVRQQPNIVRQRRPTHLPILPPNPRLRLRPPMPPLPKRLPLPTLGKALRILRRYPVLQPLLPNSAPIALLSNLRSPTTTLAHSDDADQSIRSDADQFGGKQRRAFSV